MLARHANSLHPPRTEEQQPQACSTGRRYPSRLPRKAKRNVAACVDKQLVRVLVSETGKQFASSSHRRAATSVLDWSKISLTASTQSKEERGSLCWQAARASTGQRDRQTVCILLAPKSSHKRARLVGVILGCSSAKQRGRRQPLSANRQTRKQFASACTKEQPQACHARPVGVITGGFHANQRGRRQRGLASTSCECQPNRQTICIHLAPKSSHKLARLVGDIPGGSGAKQRGRRQLLLASSSCRPLHRQTVSLHPQRTEEQPQACSTGRRRPWRLKYSV